MADESLPKEWGRTLLGIAVITLPSTIITQVLATVQGHLFAQPWQIIWVAVPLAGLSFFAWTQLKGPSARRLGTRFAIFLACYFTLFAVISSRDLLVWKRVPEANSVGAPTRNWLAPVWWGDWRYRLVRESAPKSRLLVLIEDHHDDWRPADKRRFDANIISAAVAGGASGVFFDVSYSNRAPEDARADRILCQAIMDASAARQPIPVITTYGLERNPRTQLYEMIPPPDPASTPGCLLESSGLHVYRAHAMVLADVDRTVRAIPVASWVDAPERSALSVRIAQCMMPSGCDAVDLKLPDETLLRYLPRVAPMDRREGDDQVRAVISEPAGLRGRFLLVGERSSSDSFSVPGEQQPMPGALIHAYAVSSLFSERYFERPPAWFSAFVVIAGCGVLALVALRKVAAGLLLLVALIESVVIVALAGFAAAILLVWLDVIYPLVALWLLLPLLLAYRRIVGATPAEIRLVNESAPTATA